MQSNGRAQLRQSRAWRDARARASERPRPRPLANRCAALSRRRRRRRRQQEPQQAAATSGGGGSSDGDDDEKKRASRKMTRRRCLNGARHQAPRSCQLARRQLRRRPVCEQRPRDSPPARMFFGRCAWRRRKRKAESCMRRWPPPLVLISECAEACRARNSLGVAVAYDFFDRWQQTKTRNLAMLNARRSARARHLILVTRSKSHAYNRARNDFWRPTRRRPPHDAVYPRDIAACNPRDAVERMRDA